MMFVERKGTVREKVFFNILDCLDVPIGETSQKELIDRFSLQGRIRYKDAVRALAADEGGNWVVKPVIEKR